MDPVTAIQLVASLISLVKTCRASLQAIKDFKDSDDDLADLVSDVESFTAFLQELEEVLGRCQQRSLLSSKSEGLHKVLQAARFTVLKLQRELDRLKATGSPTVRRVRWLQAHAELQKHRCRMREHASGLHGFALLLCL